MWRQIMEDLSLHVLDVAENGISAGASVIRISIEENLDADLLTIVIEDNGKGMSPEFWTKFWTRLLLHVLLVE